MSQQVSREQLTRWAESCLRMNHLGTLVRRELSAGSPSRAAQLAERARRRACSLFEELVAAGADKPRGYDEPPDEDVCWTRNRDAFEAIVARLTAHGLEVGHASFTPEVFGSWRVEVSGRRSLRVVWDGRDEWLIIQQEAAARLDETPTWDDVWIARNPEDQSAERAVQKVLEIVSS
ncbi:MAG: hypothetical protein ACHQNA_14110 [Acidimicrobiales bacterium]